MSEELVYTAGQAPKSARTYPCAHCGHPETRIEDPEAILAQIGQRLHEAPDPSAAERVIRSVPIYRCVKCGRLTIELADVLAAAPLSNGGGESCP